MRDEPAAYITRQATPSGAQPAASVWCEAPCKKRGSCQSLGDRLLCQCRPGQTLRRRGSCQSLGVGASCQCKEAGWASPHVGAWQWPVPCGGRCQVPARLGWHMRWTWQLPVPCGALPNARCLLQPVLAHNVDVAVAVLCGARPGA